MLLAIVEQPHRLATCVRNHEREETFHFLRPACVSIIYVRNEAIIANECAVLSKRPTNDYGWKDLIKCDLMTQHAISTDNRDVI